MSIIDTRRSLHFPAPSSSTPPHKPFHHQPVPHGVTVYGGNGADQLYGTNQDDHLFGGNGNDKLVGDDGDDFLDGGNGNDTLLGAAGSDTLLGANGDDVLRGGSGDDQLEGGRGNDSLNGGSGDDLLVGGQGNDTIDGGDGWDIADYWQGTTASDRLVVDLAAGTASGSQSGQDILVGVEEVGGTKGNDTLRGDGNDNYLRGNEGNDRLYGRGGDDHLDGGDGNDALYGGDGNDLLFGQAGNDLIDGGDGSDFVGYDMYGNAPGEAVYIDLAAGTASGGATGFDTLVSIENIAGTQDSDTILGDDADNGLFGESGNDVLDGRGGHDWLEGGGGDDTLSGGDGNDGLIGGDGGDVVDGGTGYDYLVGGAGNDTLSGGADGDTVVGGAGSDVIDGGDGENTLDYDQEGGGQGVSVDLEQGIATDSFGSTDEVHNILNVIGTSGADTMAGASSGEHRFFGLAGNDTFVALNGDESVWYAQDAAYGGGNGIVADLAAGSATDGFGDTDTLVEVHNLMGTNLADAVTGSSANNYFQLYAGDDSVDGGAGWDTMAYSADIFWGASSTDYIVADLAAGTVDGTFSGHDTLAGIEQIDGTQGDDTLLGNDSDNQLRGNDGNDQIEGRGGNDYLVGEAGSDTFAFHGNFGNDTIEDFTLGDDLVVFDSSAFADFSDIEAHASDTSDGVMVVTDDGDGVHLLGVSKAQLSSSDFLIA